MESNFLGEDDSNNIECSSIPVTCVSNSSKRSRKSSVWNVFSILDPEEQLVYQAKKNDTKERARCKYCEAVMIGGSISGRDYPTSNLYFENVWQIEKNIQDMLVSEDPIMVQMAKSMGDKVCKYWEDYSLVLSFAAILDPRFKLQLVQYLLPKLGPSYEYKWMGILEEFKLFFKEYENQRNVLSQSSMMIGDIEQISRRNVSEHMSVSLIFILSFQ
ncbi:hypothetical protein REPUB_Repub07fG0242500 [Reevesia pubescens]